MASATTIVNYLGEGTLANRPASPGISATALGFYYATDNATLYLWDGSAWQTIVGAGGAAITASGVALTSPFTFTNLVGKNVPLASAFTLVSTNSATLTDNTNGPLVWKCPTAGLSNTLSLAEKTVPAGSWTYTVHASIFGGNNTLCFPVGVSDGTKYTLFIVVAPNPGGSGNGSFTIQNWNTVTSFNASPVAVQGIGLAPNPMWYRVAWVSGTTTLSFSYSLDGFTWVTFYSTASPFLTPTQICFGANLSNNIALTPDTLSIDYHVQT